MDESRPPERRISALSWHAASVAVHERSVLRSAAAAAEDRRAGRDARANSNGFQRNRRPTSAGCRRGANSDAFAATNLRDFVERVPLLRHVAAVQPALEEAAIDGEAAVAPSSMQSAIAEKTTVIPPNRGAEARQAAARIFQDPNAASQRIADERDVVAPGIAHEPLAAAVDDRGSPRFIQQRSARAGVVVCEIGLASEQ